MFETRISKSWGVSKGILARYFLESLHEDIEGGINLFVARDKQSGQRLWLKVSDGSDSVNQILIAEAALWDGLQHPHLLAPTKSSEADGTHYIAYPWKGEVALVDIDSSTFSPADLIRVCGGLLDAVNYLHSLDAPVAHNRIGLSSLRLATSFGWPILTSLHFAVAGADKNALAADRKACWETVEKICFGAERSGEFQSEFVNRAKDWLDNGEENATEFSAEIGREFIRRVTADL